MKKMTWTQRWLAVVLAGGCLLLHTFPATAQDESTTNTTSSGEATSAPTSGETEWSNQTSSKTRIDRGPIVMFGGTAELKEGETAEAVVAIGGSARAKGKVRNAVVAIFGTAEADGEVGDAVVAVLGNVKLGTNANVRGDVVSVGGRVEVADGAKVGGKIVQVGTMNLPGFPQLDGLGDWFQHCVLKFRLLSTKVGWIWWIAGGYFLLYLLIAVALPKPVAACVDEMTRRPATTLLMGLLTKLLAPLVMVVLAATGIGLVVVPFIIIALKIGVLIGKAAVFVYLGRQILRGLGSSSPVQPVLALLLGSSLVTLTYMVPVLSLVIFAMTGLWAIGAAVTAAFGGLRKEMPQRPPSAQPPASAGGTPGMVVPLVAAEAVASATVNPTTTESADQGNQSAPSPIQTSVPEALALQRASFWERMGAGFLDFILIGILGSFTGPFVYLVALAYFAGMWAWKGTTVGGIVLNLKVVRHDGQPLSFLVALVRALAAAFSIIVLFLGFIWIAFDREKQGWHDKIAGTVVVRQPRGMPLVVL